MGYEYYVIPVPIGLFIFFCSVCLRVARANCGREEGGRGRLIVIRRTNQTAIPSQFETAPLIASEEGYDQRPNDVSPIYEDAQRYHQWQQQQSLQHPPPQGAYVKAMNGWNQPQQPGEATGASPTCTAQHAQSNPPPPPGLIQPGTSGAGNNGAASTGMVAGNNGAASSGMVAGNNGAVSTGMVLDVTTLPCASAQSP